MPALLKYSTFLCAVFTLAGLSATAFSAYAQQGESLLTGVHATAAAKSVSSAEVRTLEDAFRDAYSHNPTLEAARAELRSVKERIPQAYANFKPVITAKAGITSAEIEGSEFNIPGTASNEGTTSKDISLTINQPVYRGGRSSAQLSAARYIVAAQEAIYQQTLQSVMLDVVSAYMDVVRDRATLDLNLNNRDILFKQLEQTQERFNVGELTMTDIAQAKARLAAADADIISVRASLRSSEARFEEVVGYPPHKLTQSNVFIDIPQTRESAIDIAEAVAPMIKAAVNTQRAAEDDVDNVFGELLPEIGFTAQWARTYDPQPGTVPEQTNKSVALNATLPLYQAGAVRSRLRQVKEISMQRAQEVREATASVRQEIISSWENLMAAQAELEARKVQIEAASLARDGVAQEEQVGERTVLDTLDAEQEYLQAQVDMVSAQRNEIVARFTLASILGYLTPENIGFVHKKIEQGRYQESIDQQILQTNVDR